MLCEVLWELVVLGFTVMPWTTDEEEEEELQATVHFRGVPHCALRADSAAPTVGVRTAGHGALD